VLSLGLLVDDAIIAVEMMAVKLEQGWDRVKAAAHGVHDDGVPDADRHARNGRGLPADCDGQVFDRRIHALACSRSSRSR